MESKIEKLVIYYDEILGKDRDVRILDMANKIDEIIDHLNSQAQPEENEPEKVYVEPIEFNHPENTARVEWLKKGDVRVLKDTPEEKKSVCDKHHKEICRECMHNGTWTFEDTLEEWEKRYVKRFGYWGEEIKFIKQLLDEREREVRKQERMIRLHKRVSKKIDNLEEPYKSFAKAGAGIV